MKRWLMTSLEEWPEQAEHLARLVHGLQQKDEELKKGKIFF